MPAFPEAARTALGDSQLRRNLAHATSTIRAKRAAAVGEVEQWEELRVAGAAIKDSVLLDLDRYLVQLEAASDGARRARALGPRRDGGVRDRRGDHQVPRRRRGREGQVHDHPGDRAQRGARRARHRRLGDGPGRADRPARGGSPVPHPGARDPPQPSGDPRGVPARDGTVRPAGAGRSHRRAGRARRRGARAPAREVPARQGRRLGRQLRRRRDRDPGGGRVRGQRPDVPDPARGAGLGGGHREGGADLVGSRRLPAAAAALVDR